MTYTLCVQATMPSMYRVGVLYSSHCSHPVHLHLQDGCSPQPGSEYRPHPGISPGIVAGIVLTIIALIVTSITIILWSKYCRESYYYLDESGTPKQSEAEPSWDNNTTHTLTATQFLSLHLEEDNGALQQFKTLSSTAHNLADSCYYEQPVFIDGFRKSKAFYATPLPLPYKFASFWKVVWEQKVTVIVMLENTTEKGRILCDQYWPDSKAVYGQVEVSIKHTVQLANYTIRTFLVSSPGLSRKGDIRQVLHYQFTSWPHHGNPHNPLPLLNFIRSSCSHSELRGSPVIVHTNQANHRAGIFITLATILKQVKTTGEINTLAFLSHSTQRGCPLIKSTKDFLFLQNTLAEAVAAGDTNIKNSYLTRYINGLQSSFSTNGESRQFLDQQLALVNTEGSGSDQKNVCRWVPGFFSLHAFLLSPPPEQGTAQEFWRLVLDHGVHTILAVKYDKHVWSNMQDKEGPIHVTHRDDEISIKFKSKNFILEYGINVRKFVKVIFCENLLDSEALHTISLLETVHKRLTGLAKSPVMVLDQEGGKSGTAFCALMTLFEQNMYEQHSDVYQAVKTVNISRGGGMTDRVMLMKIYKVVEAMVNKEYEEKEKHLQKLQKFQKKSQFQMSVSQWRTFKNSDIDQKIY